METTEPIEFTNITKTKRNIILQIRKYHDSDKNHYNVIVKHNIDKLFIKNIKTKCELYVFKFYQNYMESRDILKRSKKLKMIIKQNSKFYLIKIRKMRAHLTKNNYKKLQNHDNKRIKLMYQSDLENLNWNRDYTYLYIYSEIKEISINDIELKPLIERVNLDIEFNIYNLNELLKFLKKYEVCELINFNNYYSNIDFEDIIKNENFNIKIDAFSNYDINIEFFNGQKFKVSSDNFSDKKINNSIKNKIKLDAQICSNFLYQNYYGTKFIKYGCDSYLEFDNYSIILKQNEKYMYVHYCVDNSTCAGFIFSLQSKIYDNFDLLWNNIEQHTKCLILKNYLLNVPYTKIINNDSSDSEFESLNS
jgi:hypothetical protein